MAPRQLITIIVVFLLASCNNSNHWTEFSAQGLPEQDEGYNDLIFVDSSTGYLGGSRTIILSEKNNQYQFANKTVLYKTQNLGKSWVRLPLDYKGSVESIFPFGDTLILLLQDVTADSVFVLKSINEGKEWKEIFAKPKKVYVRATRFTNPDSGFIITDDSKETFLLKLYNGKCDTILKLSNDHYHIRIIQNKLYSLIPKQSTANSVGISVTNIKTGDEKKLLFDKPYFICDMKTLKNILYLAVQDKNKGRILKVSDNKIKTINFSKYSDYLPDQIFVYKNTILIKVFQQKDVAFLGVIYHLLISKDNGQSWSLEKFPYSMYIKPATMYKDNYFISYCGVGRIQVRKL